MLIFAIGAVLLALITVFSTGLSAARHRAPCHTRHTCPSDHHTYVWKDPRTGKRWNCAKRSSNKFNAAKDKKKIVWEGRVYYCRKAE